LIYPLFIPEISFFYQRSIFPSFSKTHNHWLGTIKKKLEGHILPSTGRGREGLDGIPALCEFEKGRGLPWSLAGEKIFFDSLELLTSDWVEKFERKSA
jgi:hypothetical protein